MVRSACSAVVVVVVVVVGVVRGSGRGSGGGAGARGGREDERRRDRSEERGLACGVWVLQLPRRWPTKRIGVVEEESAAQHGCSDLGHAGRRRGHSDADRCGKHGDDSAVREGERLGGGAPT